MQLDLMQFDSRKRPPPVSAHFFCSAAFLQTYLSQAMHQNPYLNNRLPNNTQKTTNNKSGLLCHSRALRFIEDQRSLKNRIAKEYITEYIKEN